MTGVFEGASCFHCYLASSQNALTRRTDNFTVHTVCVCGVFFARISLLDPEMNPWLWQHDTDLFVCVVSC